MTKNTEQQGRMSELWQWLKRPPQVYVVYLVSLILIWLVSFYAGTLNPKRGTGFGPPPVSAPASPAASGSTH